MSNSTDTNGRIVARNYFTNPNLKGDGTFAEVYRNYFTNPNLVGDGTWAEVRRNLFTQPYGSLGIDRWSIRSGLTDVGPVEGGRAFSASSAAILANNFIAEPLGAYQPKLASGVTFSSAVRVRNTGTAPLPVAMILRRYVANEPENSFGPTVVIQPGASAVVGHSYVTTLDQQRVNASLVAGSGGVPIGSSFVIEDGWNIEAHPTPRLGFNPDAPFRSIDPDMRQRWLGTPNASESVMEGERVRGFPAGTAGVAAILSTAGGRSSVRVMRLSDVVAAPYVTSPSAAGSPSWTGVVSMWRPASATPKNSPAQLERSTGAYEGTIIIKTSETPPPGEWKGARVTYPFSSRTSRFNLSPPTEVGESFWFGGFGLFAGTYPEPLPVFSGDAVPSTLTQPEDFRARWVGTPNASESVIEGQKVRGTNPTRAAAIVSTRDGKPAMRVIALDATNGASRAQWSVPTALRSTGGTLRATVHVDELSTPGSYDGTFRQALQVATPIFRDQAPFQTGTFPLRADFGPLTADYVAQFGNGGKTSHPDTWFTDIGFFDSGYEGWIFSGSSNLEHPYYVGWDGAADNSSSFLYQSYSSSPTFWSVDDVSLQTHAFNISTWGGDAQSVPGLRGDDVTVPYAAGEEWMNKVPDSRTISFGMWVVGANKDGSIPAGGSSRELFERNWRMLKKLFWTPGRQINLTKRFKDWDTGEIVEATAKAEFAGGLQPTMNGTQRAQFTVQLKLADPFFYGKEESIEISPYDVLYTNAVPVPSPNGTLTNTGWGYTGGTDANFAAVTAFRRTPPTGTANINRARPDNNYARLTYESETPPLESGISVGGSSLGPAFGNLRTPSIEVTPGEVRKFSARVVLPNRANKMRLAVSFHDAEYAQVGTTQYGPSVSVPKSANPETTDVPAASATKLKIGSVTVPAGAVGARMAVLLAPDGSPWRERRTNFAEDPSFEGTYPLNEVARNKFKNPVFATGAAGTPGKSPSKSEELYVNMAYDPEFQTVTGEQVVARNYVKNPSFEPGTDATWTKSVTGGTATWSLKTGGAQSGTYYLNTNTMSSAATVMIHTLSTKTPTGDVTFSVYLRGTGASAILSVREMEGTAVIGTTSSSAAVPLTSTSNWVRVAVTHTNQKATSVNHLQIRLDPTSGTAVTNIAVDSAMLEDGNAPTPFFYYKTPTNTTDSSFFKLDPKLVSDAKNNFGAAMKYYKLPRHATARSSGVRVVQAPNAATMPGNPTATSLSVETLASGESAAQGARLYFTKADDVGSILTVTGYITVPSGYNAADDIGVGNNAVSRGIYIFNNPGKGEIQVPSTPGTHLFRAFLTPTAEGQVVSFGGGGAVGTVLKLSRLTIVRGRYEGIPFSPALGLADGGNLSYTWWGTVGSSTTTLKVLATPGVSKTPTKSYDIGFHRTQEWAYEGRNSLKVIRTGSAADAATGVSLGTYPAGRYYLQGTIQIPTGYDASEDVNTPNGASRAIGIFESSVNTQATYVQAPTTPGVHNLGIMVTLNAKTEVMLTGGGLQGQAVRWGAAAVIPVPSGSVSRTLISRPFSGDTRIPDYTFTWSSTPHNSESIMSITTGMGDPGLTLSRDPMPVFQSEVWADTGTHSLRGVSRTDDSSSAIMKLDPSWLPRDAGTYTLYAKVKFSTDASPATISRKFRLSTPTQTFESEQLAFTTSVQTVRMNFELDTNNTTWDSFWLIVGHANADVHIDSLMITEGTYTGGYFDGDTAASGTVTKWNGVKYNSTSSTVPDVIYANKFAAVHNNSPYDFFTGWGIDTVDGNPATQYFFGWAGTPGKSRSDMYAPVTTPYEFEVPGDYMTRKVRFAANAPLTAFTIRNVAPGKSASMTYGIGTETGIASIDVDNFTAFSGVRKTSAYVEHKGNYFWFPLHPGDNAILTSGIGIGNLIMYYRPAWL